MLSYNTSPVMAVQPVATRSGAPDPGVRLAFAPVHKRALGIALGTVTGAGVFALTAFHIVFRPGYALDISMLAQYFYRYDVSWTGACIGLFWGFMSGFVAGWFIAFVRNLVMAVYAFRIRTKAELAQTQDFLDHI
jgi:hypothetical protein